MASKISNFSLKNFKAKVASEGLARPTRFEVEIYPPNAMSSVYGRRETETVNLFCEITSLPPYIVGVRPQRLYGPTIYRPFGAEYGGEGISMTFYLDRSMNVKSFFDTWIEQIVNPNTYHVSYSQSYSTSMLIWQLDEQNKTTYGARLDDAFPRSIVPIELNSSNQNSIHRMVVNFAYRKWTPIHDLSDRFKEQRRGTVQIIPGPEFGQTNR